MNGPENGLVCVLITPARNESANIDRLLAAVTAQTVPPRRWIIVDDGSTDDTAERVRAYLPRFPWIELVSRREDRDRSFAAKVDGFNAGYERAKRHAFDIVGNLDADVSFEADYLEFLLGRFAADPSLGVAGTPFVEDSGYNTITDSFEGERHVAGGCQLFRRRCFEEIGGYVANPKGGIDWIAVTSARMKGWTTRSFRERSFHHHRSLGTGEGSPLAALFDYGRKDFYLGNHPLWEMLRVLYRMGRRPYLLGGLVLLTGYVRQALLREDRPVSPELIRFHRKEEMQKLKEIFKARFGRGRGPGKGGPE
ncbi:MAG: glycosyl transferase family 2 [Candidatus Aminicenantes bacterium]|nr:glycosyl transferase family 2 [Candidatus Aminicenantes bacterium]